MQASTRPSVFRLFPSSTTYSPPLIHTGRVKRHAFINNTAKRSVRFCMFCMFMRVARFCFWELGLPSIWTMHNTWLFGVQTNPHCRWRLDWLSHFCIANGCAQLHTETDIQTTLRTTFVCSKPHLCTVCMRCGQRPNNRSKTGGMVSVHQLGMFPAVLLMCVDAADV